MRRPCRRSAATGLIGGLAADKGPAIRAFEHALDQSLRRLPIRPVLLGTVSDPTFGDVRATFSASRRRSRAPTTAGTMTSSPGSRSVTAGSSICTPTS